MADAVTDKNVKVILAELKNRNPSVLGASDNTQKLSKGTVGKNGAIDIDGTYTKQ